VSSQFSRAELVSRGVKGGAVLLLAGSAAGALAGSASAALPDNDLAYLRLLVAVELLGADFYGNATKAQPYGAFGSKALERALFNEGEHYTSLAGAVTAAGQTPATADDIDFAYPSGSFASTAAVTKLAVDLETIFLGAYLGAVDGVQTASLTLPLARIAANQAQHLTTFSELLGRPPFDLSFPTALSIGDASDALDPFTA
jgi:Ferritin-like domain